MAERGYKRREYFQPSEFRRNAGIAESSLAARLQEFSSQTARMAGEAVAQESARAGEQAGMSGKFTEQSEATIAGQAYNRAAEHAYLANQTVDIEESYSRFERESQGDPAKFNTLSRNYDAGMISSSPAGARNDLIVMLRARSAQGRERVEGQAWLERRDQERTDIQAGFDVMVKQALELVKRDDPASVAALEVLQKRMAGTLQSARDAKLFSPSEIYELQITAAEKIEKGATEGAIDNQVAGILGAYRTDVYSGDHALAAVDHSEFDDATKEDIRAKVRTGLNLLQEERRRKHIDSVNAVYRDLADGTPSAGLENRVEGLYRKAAINEEAYTSLISQISHQRFENAKEEATQISAEDALLKGTRFDPKPSEDKEARKAFDVYFKSMTAGLARGGPEYQTFAIDIARRTNIIPSDVFHWARTAMASGDPVEGAQAAMLLTRIKEANNLSWDYIEDSNAKAMSEIVTDSMRAGAPPQDAVTIAHKLTYGQTDSERKALNERYSADKVSKNNARELSNRLNNDERFERAPSGMFGLSREAPAAHPTMQYEFEAQVQKYYAVTHGDAERARNMAYDDISRTWGYTEVNGRPQLMKYAPEVRFAGEITAKDIRADIDAAAPGMKAELMPIERPGASTSRSGGLKWALGVKDEYGNLEPLLDKNNLPRVYVLPVDRESWEKRDKARKAVHVGKAKAEQARMEKARDLNRRVASGNDQDAEALLERWRRDDLASGN